MSFRRWIPMALVAAPILAMLLGGCAHRPPRRPPGQAPVRRVLVDTVRTMPAPGVTIPPERSERLAAARDTAYVVAVLRRCGTRALLPDQESTREALTSMLAEARAALLRGDVEHGRSAARNARQLATSLRCP